MAHKIESDILDVALRCNGIQLCDSILTEVTRVVNILQEKGEKATLKDVINKNRE